jgi:hypothetical protein
MKNNIFFIFMYFVVLLSLYSQNKNEFYLESINDDFIGVYLPIEYIDSLEKTKNHSLSLHLNDKSRYHDVLSVNKNIIYSNLKWHDQYAIRATEVNLFQFTKNGKDVIIIDNNGYSYKKTGNDPNSYYSIADTFVGNIVFKNLLDKGIGVGVDKGRIIIPFLYFFTSQDTYNINLDDMFYEKGSNILLYNQNDRSSIGLFIDGENYLFYKLSRIGDIYEKSDLIFSYKLNEDKNIIYALTGIIKSHEFFEDTQYLDILTENDKRIIINTMFALNGYSFTTEQWQIYFNKYSWYKPNNAIRNDPDILNIRQKRLLDYLNQ